MAHNASEVLTYVPPFSPTAISLHAPPPQPEDSLTRDTHAPTYIHARRCSAPAATCPHRAMSSEWSCVMLHMTTPCIVAGNPGVAPRSRERCTSERCIPSGLAYHLAAPDAVYEHALVHRALSCSSALTSASTVMPLTTSRGPFTCSAIVFQAVLMGRKLGRGAKWC